MKKYYIEEIYFLDLLEKSDELKTKLSDTKLDTESDNTLPGIKLKIYYLKLIIHNNI